MLKITDNGGRSSDIVSEVIRVPSLDALVIKIEMSSNETATRGNAPQPGLEQSPPLCFDATFG